MKKVILAVIGIAVIGFGVFLGKDYLPRFTSSDGELRIDTAPKSTVFINGENKGQSPYLEQVKPGEYDVKLIPENESVTASWQQQITVNPGVQTYINANLSQSADTSSWEIITLENAGRSDTEISIFSESDPAEIFFDGERKGTTPLSFQEISAGTHDVRLVIPGHIENTIKVTLTPGYKLILNAQLALDEIGKKQLEEEQKEKELEDPKRNTQTLTIKDTPFGWLRVRDDSTTSAEELGKVNTGDSFEVIEEANGWYKIEFEKDKEGWVSGTYAELSDTSADKKEASENE